MMFGLVGLPPFGDSLWMRFPPLSRHVLPIIIGLIILIRPQTSDAQTTLTWQGESGGEWNAAGNWKSDSESDANWVDGSVAIFPLVKGGEIAIDMPGKIVATSVWVQQNTMTIQGNGPLVLNVNPEEKPMHAFRAEKTTALDVPIQLDGGGSQSWLTGSRDQELIINKGISEATPTGITFAFGTLVLNAPSTFTGGIIFNNASVVIANDAGAGTGPLIIGEGKSVLSTGGGDRTIKNNLTTPWVGAGGANWNFEGSGTLTLDAPVNFQGAEAGTVNISVADGLKVIFKQGVVPPPERRTQILQGIKMAGQSGTLVLEGEISYRGTTTVESGRLVMNGTSELQKSWKLTAPGILSGTGAIGLAGTEDSLAASGTLSPASDDSVGILRITGDMKILSGFRYLWNFGAKSGEGDRLDLQGAVAMDGTGSDWKVIVCPAAGATLMPGTHTYQILAAQGGVADSAVSNASLELDPSLPAGRVSGKLQTVNGGINLILTVK